jgi:hypothetical protein
MFHGVVKGAATATLIAHNAATTRPRDRATVVMIFLSRQPWLD